VVFSAALAAASAAANSAALMASTVSDRRTPFLANSFRPDTARKCRAGFFHLAVRLNYRFLVEPSLNLAPPAYPITL
jgi:hypothetical protein